MTDAPTKPTKPTLITVDNSNNPVRCRMLIYHKGLEEQVDLDAGDFGGTSSPPTARSTRKIPTLRTAPPSSRRAILNYLCEKHATSSSPLRGDAGGARAGRDDHAGARHLHRLAEQQRPVGDGDAGRDVQGRRRDRRNEPRAKFAELDKQLDVLESLLSKEGPYAAGASSPRPTFRCTRRSASSCGHVVRHRRLAQPAVWAAAEV